MTHRRRTYQVKAAAARKVPTAEEFALHGAILAIVLATVLLRIAG
ncbi:MAG TPA: hypothetical protein VG845_15210 [Dehalococcoidia bacterium]|jgi:hypothetical protein|nr:hypothetical protein [Dehalococcoidia bacterium]